MSKSEWDELERWGMKDCAGIAKPRRGTRYREVLDKTRLVDEHPEGYEGPCLCRLCCSYGD